MRVRIVVLILAALSLATARAGAQSAGTAAMPTAPGSPSTAVSGAVANAAAEMLRPGDILRITVWRKPELSGEFGISPDGTVAEPFYMGIRVTGLPFAEVAARIRAHVEQYETLPQVLVEPLYRVAVGGEVQRPDVYSLGPSTTVRQAVLLAGGPTPQGDLKRVRLYRDGVRLRVNLQDPEDSLGAGPVRSGDHVAVDRVRPIFRDYVLPGLMGLGAVASIARLIAH